MCFEGIVALLSSIGLLLQEDTVLHDAFLHALHHQAAFAASLGQGRLQGRLDTVLDHSYLLLLGIELMYLLVDVQLLLTQEAADLVGGGVGG